MNRRARSPERFGRAVRPRLADPPRLLLFTPHSDRIRGGPADNVPLVITMTPIQRPNVPDQAYIQELALAFQITMIGLVKQFARRARVPQLTSGQIRHLPIFFFPTDVFFI